MKKPLSKEEHIQLAKDLRKAQEILEPWMDTFYKTYPVNGKECRELKTVLNLLSSKICCSQDNHWYKIPYGDQDHKTPYYGSGKVAWS